MAIFTPGVGKHAGVHCIRLGTVIPSLFFLSFHQERRVTLVLLAQRVREQLSGCRWAPQFPAIGKGFHDWMEACLLLASWCLPPALRTLPARLASTRWLKVMHFDSHL